LRALAFCRHASSTSSVPESATRPAGASSSRSATSVVIIAPCEKPPSTSFENGSPDAFIASFTIAWTARRAAAIPSGSRLRNSRSASGA
jgi:hypothetical protein